VGLYDLRWPFIRSYFILKIKDKNVHKLALSAIRGELLEREREREIVFGYYTQVTYFP
jgi:hypothetical protein